MSPFREEWLECLRAQYAYAVKSHDSNEQSVKGVLEQAGFTESEIEEIKIIATMREE